MAKKSTSSFFEFLANNYLYLGLLISSISTVGSLFLSEVMQFPPCDLCWFQRALMYPLPVLFAVALWKTDNRVAQYILPLSLIGFAIALYHYVLQLFPTIIPCTSSSVSCADKQIELLGFITIPFMSGAAFLALIILSLIYKKVKNV